MENAVGILEKDVAQPQDQVEESGSLPISENVASESNIFGRIKNRFSRRIPAKFSESPEATSVDDVELTEEQAVAVENLARNAGLLNWTAEHIKALGVPAAGALAGAGLTFLSLVSGPVPPEIAGTLAATVGGATIGGGVGETRREKLQHAAYGAAAGLAASQGMGQLTEDPTAKAALGFVDDLPTAFIGVNAAAKAAGRRFSRMHAPEIRTPLDRDEVSPALVS